jgi:hypothetical protein
MKSENKLKSLTFRDWPILLYESKGPRFEP